CLLRCLPQSCWRLPLASRGNYLPKSAHPHAVPKIATPARCLRQTQRRARFLEVEPYPQSVRRYDAHAQSSSGLYPTQRPGRQSDGDDQSFPQFSKIKRIAPLLFDAPQQPSKNCATDNSQSIVRKPKGADIFIIVFPYERYFHASSSCAGRSSARAYPGTCSSCTI